MARALRVEFPGAIYHVTVRMLGDARASLFRDDGDRSRLLAKLEERVEGFDIRLYALCLMRNHYHLVLETPRANLQQFMHALNTAYSTYYNLRHRRHGHLLDGRYGAKLVEGDEYLLALSRYVHLNPVKVGRVKDQPLADRLDHLGSYRWSSLCTYIGKGEPLEFVEPGPLLAEMGGRRRENVRRYRAFVEGGVAEKDTEFLAVLKASPRSIGTKIFQEWVDGLYEDLMAKQGSPQDVSFRRALATLPPDKVLAAAADVLGFQLKDFRTQRHGSVLRGIAGRLLRRFSGLTQREAARILGLRSGAAVSAQIGKLGGKLKEDRKLARQLAHIEERLHELRHKHQNVII